MYFLLMLLSLKKGIVSESLENNPCSFSILISKQTSLDSDSILTSTGGSNRNWINILKKFTDNGEFIGIYPQGYLRSWNLGSENSTADDVEFTDMIFEELAQYNFIDFSNLFNDFWS